MPPSSTFSAEADPILLRDVEDPQTLGERLRAITLREDCTRSLREKIAKHPNCPPDLLQQYFTSFPMQAMQNPALPLLLIENPAFFLSLQPSAVIPSLEEADTPAWLIETLRRHPRPEVAELAEWHVAIKGDISSDWEYCLNAWFFACATKSPAVRDHMAELLNLRLIPEKLQSEFSHRLLLYTDEPSIEIADASDKEEKEEIKPEETKEEKEARNPGTPRKRLLELAQSNNPRWHRALSGNPNVPGEVLAAIVIASETPGEWESTLIGVALHPQTTVETQNALLKKTLPVVRALARRNTDITESVRIGIVNRLRQSRTELTGLYLFSLARVADEAQIMQTYRLNPHWHERLGLALNPELPDGQLKELARDPNALVRTVAKARQDDPRVPTWFWGNIKLAEPPEQNSERDENDENGENSFK
jgi:hypothetical protein